MTTLCTQSKNYFGPRGVFMPYESEPTGRKKLIMNYLIPLLLITTFSVAQELPKVATDIAPLLIGENIPDLSLRDINGEEVSLRNLASQKQTILIFYRGGWCPYCNLHLGELQTIEGEILEAGYQIVAISPDAPENLKVSIDKNKLNYTLLSDGDTQASRGFGIAFEAPDKDHEKLRRYSANGNKGILPVPAVFVLNTQGEILFEYINPDYKKRIKSSLLLAVLIELKDQ